MISEPHVNRNRLDRIDSNSRIEPISRHIR